MFFKRKKSLDFREYYPDSTLKVPESKELSDYPIIDSHIHLGPKYPGENFLQRYSIDEFVNMLKSNGVIHTIDLELFSEEYFKGVLEYIRGYEDFFSFCAPINLSDFEEPDFSNTMQSYMIDMAKNKSVCGFKIWKDLGLNLRRKNKSLAKINDPEFNTIWKTCENLNLPVVIHVADPIAFFQKADCHNERLEELMAYPMWNYSQSSEVRHEELIEQFSTVLKNFPGTKFVATHLLNCASDIDLLSSMLEKHPNLNVDIAAVLSEIGRQPRSFGEFADKFQGRILFGTDSFGGDPAFYPYYKRFLETEDEYFEYRPNNDLTQGRWRIYGCGLKDEVLKKIYCDNANRIFRLR